MGELLKSITKAIEASGKTRYRIAKDAGVAQSQLSRLVHGKLGVSLETLEKLAKSLGYEVKLIQSGKRKDR